MFFVCIFSVEKFIVFLEFYDKEILLCYFFECLFNKIVIEIFIFIIFEKKLIDF